MRVRCPWCDRPGVALTRQGLMKHPAGELAGDKDPVCEGVGQRIVMTESGQIVKALRENREEDA
jgi:hypothetical protein